MVNHVNYIAHSRGEEGAEEVDFVDVLCLYANHRPLQEVRGGDGPVSP
jgi:hypothetical protein